MVPPTSIPGTNGHPVKYPGTPRRARTSTKFKPAYSTLMVTWPGPGAVVPLGEPDNFRTAWLGDFHCSHWRLQSDRYRVRMPKLAAIWLTAMPR